MKIEPLNPIAFQLGPITVHWYGVIIALGVMLALYVATRESVRLGLPKDLFMDLVLIAAPIAIVCARIYYVTFKWDYYSTHLNEIPQIWNGGIAIHGALIGSFVTGIIFARHRNIPFLKIADIAAPSLLIGQAIGRWGNFMNQEAHGGPVTRSFLEGLRLPEWMINQMYIEGMYYHPTFLYESVWNVVGVFLLIALRSVHRLRRGEIFFSYFIWYGIGRFMIEGLRTDSLMLTEYLRIAQVVSLTMVVFGVAMIIFRRVRGDKTLYNEGR